MPEEKYELKMPDGSSALGTRVQVLQSQEHFNTYLLEDGTAIRTKQVVVEIFRIHDRFDGDGNPMYLMKQQGVMSVTAPKELRKPEGE